MLYVDIGSSRVPSLGLGTWQLQGDACRRAVADALELGYRHVDTAQAYDNEEDVGRGLRDSGVDRSDVWITTKLWTEDKSADEVRRDLDGSLRSLGIDVVDLVLVHWPAHNVSNEVALEALFEARERGKVKEVGVSNFTPKLMVRASKVGPIAVNQVEYHPFLSQRVLLEHCRREGIVLTAYCPLARGTVSDDPTLQEIARRYDKTPAQVALRWLLEQPKVSAVPKASKPEHRRANLDIFDFELTDDEMRKVFDLSRGERLIDPEWSPRWGELP